MALASTGSPLVSGGLGVNRKAAPAAGPVRLLRAICIKGERIEPGTVLQLDRALSSELISANKAERVPALLAPVQTPAQAAEAAKAKKPAAAAAATPQQKDPNHVEQ